MKQLTLYAEDFPAKTSALPDEQPDSQVSDPVSGISSTDLSKKRSRSTSSSKMLQPFALEDWTKFSAASLRSGLMRSGIVYPLQPLARLTKGTGSGWWLTPNVMDSLPPRSPEALRKHFEKNRQGRTMHSTLREQVVYPPPKEMWPTPSSRDHKGGYIGGRIRNGKISWDTLDVAVQWTDNQSKANGILNPEFVEWLMGFPVGHTDLGS